MARVSYKGKFTPTNPSKYKGNAKNIIYRSLWERKVMTWLDSNRSVIEWNSEEIIIPYLSPFDKRYHRYFPDFWARMKSADGSIKTLLIEVKPKSQTVEPKKKSRITRRYIEEYVTYGVNQAKWKQAQEYCDDRGWEFRVITEDEIFA